MCTVDISAPALAGWKFEDAHVCHDFAAAGAFERDVDEFEVCDEGMLRFLGCMRKVGLTRAIGTQYAHWHGDPAEACGELRT